jgi:hypothetical protein
LRQRLLKTSAKSDSLSDIEALQSLQCIDNGIRSMWYGESSTVFHSFAIAKVFGPKPGWITTSLLPFGIVF